jgi:hypothetical protein
MTASLRRDAAIRHTRLARNRSVVIEGYKDAWLLEAKEG